MLYEGNFYKYSSWYDSGIVISAIGLLLLFLGIIFTVAVNFSLPFLNFPNFSTTLKIKNLIQLVFSVDLLQ